MSRVAATLSSLILTAVGSTAVADTDHVHGHADTGTHVQRDHHEQIELPADEAPTLALGLAEDGSGGYALSLETARFSFAREHADGPHIPGEGHAHLYIDGRKTGRIYSQRHVLEPFAPGTHEIEVTLVGNDNRGYATRGVDVASRYVLWEPEERPAPKPLTRLPFSIRDGKLASDNKNVKVTQNDRVELLLSADHPVSLHLHGYDVEVTVTPDFPVTFHFIASIPGRFAIEEHSGSNRRHSALAYIEVYPE